MTVQSITVRITVEHEDGSQLIFDGLANTFNMVASRERAPLRTLGSSHTEFVAGRSTTTFEMQGIITENIAIRPTDKIEMVKEIKYHKFDFEE